MQSFLKNNYPRLQMRLFVTNFSIRIFEQSPESSPFSMKGGVTLLQIDSNKSLFNPSATVILADPFLFVRNGMLYLFYERLEKWFGTGRLCMRSTFDLLNWSDEVDVLSEPFHLSFPFVFEDNGKVYMLPETGGDKSIRLYEAEDETLSKWRLVKKLMENNEPWYDSVLYKKDGLYYLFTGLDDNVFQEEHLFVSENLTGPYEEHPASPIYNGRDGGRNAGSIIESPEGLFRPVQICINGYGEQTSVMKIETLSPTEYKEILYKKNVIDTSLPPYKFGGHQWNEVNFMGKRIVATDYREKNYNLIELSRRIKREFLK